MTYIFIAGISGFCIGLVAGILLTLICITAHEAGEDLCQNP